MRTLALLLFLLPAQAANAQSPRVQPDSASGRLPERACLVRQLRGEGYRVEVTGTDSSRVQLTRSLSGPREWPDHLTQLAQVILANGAPQPYSIELTSTVLRNGRMNGEDPLETDRFRARLHRELEAAVERCSR